MDMSPGSSINYRKSSLDLHRGCGSAQSNRKLRFHLLLLSPFAIFASIFKHGVPVEDYGRPPALLLQNTVFQEVRDIYDA